MNASLTGAEFKTQLHAGATKLGLFLNSHSPTVADQLAHSGYDWLLVDTQHGPMGNESLSGMLAGIANGGATSMVRVGGYSDRPCIQQSLDMGADGVLVPYINTADEARAAVSCCRYPTAGTRSVYFPQRSMNKGGLLGYAGAANDNVIVALSRNRRLHQEHRRDCGGQGRRPAVPRPGDLCMSMGLTRSKFRTCIARAGGDEQLIAAAARHPLGVSFSASGREFIDRVRLHQRRQRSASSSRRRART
jgi:4-hydroxy-2-oxoheptanedioate aldolase